MRGDVMISRIVVGVSVAVLVTTAMNPGPASGVERSVDDGAAALSTAAPDSTEVITTAARPRWGHVMGIADLNNKPVRKGRVSVHTLTGRPLTVRGPVRRTGRTGVFHVRVRNLPEFFQVEVRGGKFGHRRLRNRVLRSIGWARERGEVVNQASTIAAYNLTTQSPRQLRRHPKRMTRQSTRRTARLLGLHRPRHRFSLGLAARTTSQVYDPGRAFVQAQRGGFNQALKRWGTKASSRHAHRTFEPRRYRGNTPIGWDSKGRHHKLGVTPACEGVTACLLVVLKNTAVSLVGSGVKAGICKAGGGVPVIASLTGCGTNQNIAQILSLLNEMNEQLTNMEAQMTEILTMLAQQAQTDAYNASGLPQLEGVYDAWLMDLLELSDPAVEVQPLSVLPADSTIVQICGAAYLSSAAVPDPYEGYSFTQTPYAACQDAGGNTGNFVGPTATGAWASLIFQSLTGYGPLYPVDDLVAPTYQTGLSNGGTQLITGDAQNSLNQLLSSFVGMQAAAYQAALAWQTFSFAWTGQQVTCPNTPLPTQFTDPENQPLSMTGPCATTVTALFESSLEAYIAQNLGPRGVLPAETLLDTYNADGDAQVPVWWSAAVDVTAASWYDGGNPWYPYSPIDNGEVSPQYVALQDSPLATPGTAVPVVSTATDTFTFGDESQLTTLTDHALAASKAGSINGALSSVGFYGPGDWLYMSYTYLVTDVQRIGFETVCESEYNCPEPYGAGSCFDDSAQPPTIPVGSGSIYQCYPGQGSSWLPYAGVFGTYGTTYLTLNKNVVTTKSCPGGGTLWSPDPLPDPGVVSPWCQPPQNPADVNDASYYGLLLDTTPGDVLWSNGIYQEWQDQTIPVPAAS